MALKLENLEKRPKFLKNVKKLQKLVLVSAFLSVVPNHIAHKIVIASNFVSQKALINF